MCGCPADNSCSYLNGNCKVNISIYYLLLYFVYTVISRINQWSHSISQFVKMYCIKSTQLNMRLHLDYLYNVLVHGESSKIGLLSFYQAENDSGADVANTMMQKFWDSALNLEPPDDYDDSHRLLSVCFVANIEFVIQTCCVCTVKCLCP